MHLASGSMIELASGPYRARLSPSAGGRLAELSWHQGDEVRHLLVPWSGGAFDEHAWPKAGAFPMLPFANRLPPHGFRFAGRQVRPAPGPLGFAQHGVAHRRPWDVCESSAHYARLQSVHAATEDWPWPWTAWQDIALDHGGIQVTLTVRNDAATPMPLSMGWHPYHLVQAAIRSSDLRFQARFRHALDAEGAALPESGLPTFGMQRGDTTAYSGWKGLLRLQLDAEACAAIECTGTSALVLHRPRLGDYVCVEPVSALPGQLACRESPLPGGLAPGSSQQLRWRCGLEQVEDGRV